MYIQSQYYFKITKVYTFKFNDQNSKYAIIISYVLKTIFKYLSSQW